MRHELALHSTASKSDHHLTHPKYRPDIDGLRAIAILFVVGFHTFPNWIHGGFIGVDIFFVISGYLISTIIMGSLERNSFSFIDFYIRRINRIFPALLVVLIASFAFGWFVLLADEYKQLGKHIAGGAGFISNYLFWGESGYFDNAADTKPLLHLWSLGIEEQYYVIWPLLLWFVWKQKFNLLTITLLVALISFSLNVVQVNGGHLIEAFYSPQTRFWELLIGSVLAYMTLHHQNLFSSAKHKLDMWLVKIIYTHTLEANGKTLRNVQSLLGVVFFVIGFVFITREGRFPGWWAVLPTLGAVLIISAGKEAWFNRVVLSNRVLVWVGLISFPLYLWHWPLLSFVRIVGGETPSREIRVTVVLIAIVLAWLTYRLIEKPIRFGQHGKAKSFTLLVLMVIVGYMGYNSFNRDGLPFRAFAKQKESYTKTIVRSSREKECFEIPFAFEKSGDWYCQLGERNSPPSYFAYGDSHALSLIPVLEKFGIEHKANLLFTGTSGCPPLLGIQSERGAEGIAKFSCQKLNERIFEYVKKNNIKSVLLISRWTYYTEGTTKPDEVNGISAKAKDSSLGLSGRGAFKYGIHQTIERYKNIGVRVYLFEDNPQQEIDPKNALKKSRLTDSTINQFSVTTAEHKNNQSWVSSQFSKIPPDMATVINFDELLCETKRCPFVKDGKFLYFDDDHLSIDGAMLLYPHLVKALSPSL
jgi:peptidoglycan/LPS O-acetylase OafA/YrhL